jgi:hypothetical protein
MRISTFRRAASPLFVTVLLAGSAGAAAAQDRFAVMPRGGYAMPAGQLANLVDGGPAYGLDVTIGLTDRLNLRADGMANMLSGKTLSTGRNSPDMSVLHYGLGLEFALLRPEVMPITVSADAGLGASRFDTDRFPIADYDSREFDKTYASARLGLGLGYDVRQSISVLLGARAYFVNMWEAETRTLTNLDPYTIKSFSTGVTIPVSLGVRARL